MSKAIPGLLIFGLGLTWLLRLSLIAIYGGVFIMEHNPWILGCEIAAGIAIVIYGFGLFFASLLHRLRGVEMETTAQRVMDELTRAGHAIYLDEAKAYHTSLCRALGMRFGECNPGGILPYLAELVAKDKVVAYWDAGRVAFVSRRQWQADVSADEAMPSMRIAPADIVGIVFDP